MAVICTSALAQNAAPAFASKGCTLIINIDGFRNARGAAGATIFTSPNGWPEDNKQAYRLGR